ncbi:MAG: hypothetical protein R2864_10325 [Syntrophotaleaceae bacterium]
MLLFIFTLLSPSLRHLVHLTGSYGLRAIVAGSFKHRLDLAFMALLLFFHNIAPCLIWQDNLRLYRHYLQLESPGFAAAKTELASALLGKRQGD